MNLVDRCGAKDRRLIVLMFKCSEFAAVEAKCTIGWLEEGESAGAEVCG